MKRRFSILTAAFALLVFMTPSMVAWGQNEATWDPSYSSNTILHEVTIQIDDNISATFNRGMGSTSPQYYTNGDAVRMYGSNTLTITSSSNSLITQILINLTQSVGFSVSSGSYVVNNNVGTWTGDPSDASDAIVFTNNVTGQNRISSITVSYSTGGDTPQPTTYTVTYNANGGTGTMTDENSPYDAGATVTVLDNEFTRDGYVFEKWNTDADGNGADYDEGDQFTINANTTLFAQWIEQSSGDEQWVLTSLADLTANDVFVIVSTKGTANYAMSNDKGATAAPTAVSVDIANNQITSAVVSTIKWTGINGNTTDGYTIYSNADTTKHLYCINNNNGVRVGSGDDNTFVIKDNYIYNKGQERYLGVYNNADWRSYTSINNNISGQTFAFYKKVTGGVIPPSISAENVSIEYHATSGSIVYTINNEVEGGTMSASTTADWITLGNNFDSPIAFNCTANEAGTARTATVTLTYTYNRETVTIDVIITQAAAPVVYSTIPALFEAATGTAASVLVTFDNWVVSGVSTNGKNVFVTDNNGNGFVIFDNGGGLDDTYAVNDILAGTAVSCSLVLYHGFAELTGVNAADLTITDGGTVTEANIALADLAGVNTGALVSYENLTCSVTTSGDNTFYNLSDGTTTIQVYNALYVFEALTDGKTYNITGVYQQYNTTKEILPRSAADIEEVVVTVPSITVTPTEVNISAEGATGSLTVTCENIDDSYEIGVRFYEDPQTPATDPAIYEDWFEIVPAGGSSNDFHYEAYSNEGDARTAYLTICAFAANGEMLTESQLVTVNQSAPVVPATGDEYALYTGEIVEGDYLIVYNGGAMNNTVSSSRLQYESVTVTNDAITTDNAAIVWHIAPSGDYWTLYNVDANAYAASTGTKNQAQMLANGTDDKALWMVSGTETYEFVNKKNAASSVNANLRKNGTYGFACYATSTGGALSLYKKVETLPDNTIVINGYGESEGGYYLIASPFTVDPAEIEGMILTGDDAENYDLYYFDQSQQDEEWQNYKQTTFNLVPGKGYLYARSTTVNLTFEGEPYDGDGSIELDYTEGVTFSGWNLVGNPFSVAAEISDDYYVMNEDGSEIIAGESDVVEPMQGVFVIAESADDFVMFEPVASTTTEGKLVMNVSRNRGNVIDRAIVRFDEGGQLPKFQLFENSTKLYIPQGNNDYAVVRSAAESEMPVNFKAKENGTYTIGVNTENIEMDYLHLIDNMTGTDVDLLQTPSYTFEASTRDYASRFRLVFSADENGASTGSATFAYFNGNEWVVSNEGDAQLHVIDMTGRIVSTETINGNATVKVNAAPGVYMLRLVNGNDIKTQKVIIK